MTSPWLPGTRSPGARSSARRGPGAQTCCIGFTIARGSAGASQPDGVGASNASGCAFAAVREAITLLLKTPVKDVEVAAALDLTTAQAKAWLQRLADEGVIEKQKKPAGYIVKQSGLFE